jgi:hypothetical protein
MARQQRSNSPPEGFHHQEMSTSGRKSAVSQATLRHRFGPAGGRGETCFRSRPRHANTTFHFGLVRMVWKRTLFSLSKFEPTEPATLVLQVAYELATNFDPLGDPMSVARCALPATGVLQVRSCPEQQGKNQHPCAIWASSFLCPQRCTWQISIKQPNSRMIPYLARKS